MKNMHKAVIAAGLSIASFVFFGIASDCPGTANYEKCPLDYLNLAWLVIAMLMISASIIVAFNINVSGSDEDEDD